MQDFYDILFQQNIRNFLAQYDKGAFKMHGMVKKLSLIISLTFLLFEGCQAFAAPAIKLSTSVSILSATDFQNNSFRGVNLSYNAILSEKDFEELAANGAKLVRAWIPLYRCKTCSYYAIDPKHINYAKQVVSYGEKFGFHVVIVLQPLPAGNNSDYWQNSKLLTSIAQNWQLVASTFKNNPTVAGYDLINEPVPHQMGATANNLVWFNLANHLITAIRNVDPAHAIIIEVAPWDLPGGFSGLKPLPFQNLIYSVHFYEPHEITHQTLPGYATNYTYPGVVNGVMWDKAKLAAALDPVRQFAKTYKVPIYVGEFSCIRFAPGNSRAQWIKDVVDLIDAEGWSWTYHQYRGWDGWDAEVDSKNPAYNQRSSSATILTFLKQDFNRHVPPQSSHL